MRQIKVVRYVWRKLAAIRILVALPEGLCCQRIELLQNIVRKGNLANLAVHPLPFVIEIRGLAIIQRRSDVLHCQFAP